MSMPRSYLVRIYRQGFDLLSGTVEDVSTSGRRSFSSLAELGGHLMGPIDPEAGPDGVPLTDTPLNPGE